MAMQWNENRNYRIHISGIVQGVGFRPFVYRNAGLFHLNGWVNNQGADVVIEIEGSKKNIKEFVQVVLKTPPELAKIERVRISHQELAGYIQFTIACSNPAHSPTGFVSPDVAVCSPCLEDMNNPESSRYGYAFTNCTDCGPRYSILQSLPFDRSNTTMSVFQMCSSCRKEYEDPNNRRFHAQAICCPDCGPNLKLLNRNGADMTYLDAVKTAEKLLKQGHIIAIKGIGGYHLCCNASDNEAVSKLRSRKNRPDRPLAIMARDIQSVEKICQISHKEKEVLISRQRPIVLLDKKQDKALSRLIAPMNQQLGIMLPYTPLHFLLFSDEMEYLVMTSGNISSLPISYKDKDAIQKLKDTADYFLVHDREIHMPVDDSVVRVINGEETVSRSSRGYAPMVRRVDCPFPLLALGAEQKSSICLSQPEFTYISQYIGDLKDYRTFMVYTQTIEHYKKLFLSNPKVYVHDLNPNYLSIQYAQSQEGVKIGVQHHHAHMAGCMAENELYRDAIGIIFDGTGLGTDGAVWGGEFITGSGSSFHREGHLSYVTLQGGDAVVKEPWRSAACYLHSLALDPHDYLYTIEPYAIDICIQAIHKGINCCQSSSMGRLFDCIAAMTRLRAKITYDAQAAIELENQIDCSIRDAYAYEITEGEQGIILGYEYILLGVIKDLKDHASIPVIAARFHNTIVKAATECVYRIYLRTGLKDVVLSGGCFENRYLLTSMIDCLKESGLKPYHHSRIPANDGGISFGQAVIAAQLGKDGAYVSGCSSKDY